MPGINVSALNSGDLRRLLKIAHARHDGLLADQLEWEIATRGARIQRPVAPRARPDEDDPDEPDFHVADHDAEPFTLEPEAEEPAFAEPNFGEPTFGRGRFALVTAGAVAGSLISAGVFWGLTRMDRASVVREELYPMRAMAALPAPATDQTLAALAPEPLLQVPEPNSPVAPLVIPHATAALPAPVAAPAAEVAKPAEPAKPLIAQPQAASAKEAAPSKPTAAKTQLAAKAPSAAKAAPTRKALALKQEPAAKTRVIAKDTAVKKPAGSAALTTTERKPRPPTLDEWLAQPSPTPR